MRLSRFTTRRLTAAVAISAVLLAGYTALHRCLGPRPGMHKSPYRYLGRDWRWHEIRGGVIWVSERGDVFGD